MCLGIRISSPIHLTTLTIPIQNKNALKRKKTHPMTTIFPLSFEVQPRLCRLYKCIHWQPKPNLCLPALLSKHHRRTVEKKSPSFTIFLLPIHKGAGLSEEQCLCVIVIVMVRALYNSVGATTCLNNNLF